MLLRHFFLTFSTVCLGKILVTDCDKFRKPLNYGWLQAIDMLNKTSERLGELVHAVEKSRIWNIPYNQFTQEMTTTYRLFVSLFGGEVYAKRIHFFGKHLPKMPGGTISLWNEMVKTLELSKALERNMRNQWPYSPNLQISCDSWWLKHYRGSFYLDNRPSSLMEDLTRARGIVNIPGVTSAESPLDGPNAPQIRWFDNLQPSFSKVLSLNNFVGEHFWGLQGGFSDRGYNTDYTLIRMMPTSRLLAERSLTLPNMAVNHFASTLILILSNMDIMTRDWQGQSHWLTTTPCNPKYESFTSDVLRCLKTTADSEQDRRRFGRNFQHLAVGLYLKKWDWSTGVNLPEHLIVGLQTAKFNTSLSNWGLRPRPVTVTSPWLPDTNIEGMFGYEQISNFEYLNTKIQAESQGSQAASQTPLEDFLFDSLQQSAWDRYTHGTNGQGLYSSSASVSLPVAITDPSHTVLEGGPPPRGFVETRQQYLQPDDDPSESRPNKRPRIDDPSASRPDKRPRIDEPTQQDEALIGEGPSLFEQFTQASYLQRLEEYNRPPHTPQAQSFGDTTSPPGSYFHKTFGIPSDDSSDGTPGNIPDLPKMGRYNTERPDPAGDPRTSNPAGAANRYNYPMIGGSNLGPTSFPSRQHTAHDPHSQWDWWNHNLEAGQQQSNPPQGNLQDINNDPHMFSSWLHPSQDVPIDPALLDSALARSPTPGRANLGDHLPFGPVNQGPAHGPTSAPSPSGDMPGTAIQAATDGYPAAYPGNTHRPDSNSPEGHELPFEDWPDETNGAHPETDGAHSQRHGAHTQTEATDSGTDDTHTRTDAVHPETDNTHTETDEPHTEPDGTHTDKDGPHTEPETHTEDAGTQTHPNPQSSQGLSMDNMLNSDDDLYAADGGSGKSSDSAGSRNRLRRDSKPSRFVSFRRSKNRRR